MTIEGGNDNWFSSIYLHNRYLKAGEINFASPEGKLENLVVSGHQERPHPFLGEVVTPGDPPGPNTLDVAFTLELTQKGTNQWTD